MLVMLLKPPQCCYANQSSSQSQRWGQVWSHDPTVIGKDGADVDGALRHWMISQAQAHKIKVTTRTDVKELTLSALITEHVYLYVVDNRDISMARK